MTVPPHDIEQWNDTMARLYEPDKFITQTGWIVRKVQSLRLEKTRKALSLTGHETLLDVGCGSGNLLAGINAREIVGIDLSDYLLDQARARLKNQANVKIVKANAETIPFPDKYFDRVVCSEVLEHVKDVPAVLKEIHRVCKPGARLIITLPNEHLINITKKIVLQFGLKRWIAGHYPMSDNMMDQWHLSEIETSDLEKLASPFFRLTSVRPIPIPLFAYHKLFVLERK